MNCGNLTELILPSTVQDFNVRLYTSITSIELSEENQYYTVSNGVLYNKNQTILYKASKNVINYVMPDSVTEMKSYAFIGSNVETVILNDVITSIPNDAFRDCNFLSSIELGSSITTIDTCAFSNCISLTTIKFNDDTTIDSFAFSNSGLTSVNLTNCNMKFESYGFFQNSENLSSVILPVKSNAIPSNAFYGCKSLTSIRWIFG